MMSRMNGDKKRRGLASNRPFLQPLAVAIVCLLLVCLLFIMGLVNLRALDRTLAGYMESRGRDILREVHQNAERYYLELNQVNPPVFDPVTGSPLAEGEWSLQESFLTVLIAEAQAMDVLQETPPLKGRDAKNLLRRERLSNIAFLDERGRVLFESSPIPPAILSLSAPVIRGEKEFETNIFAGPENGERLRFLSLRRRSGKGTLIFVMDRESLQYRMSRFSLQRSISDERINIPGIEYLDIAESEPGASGPPEGLPAATGVKIKRIFSRGQSTLEFVTPVHLGGVHSATIRLGLEATKQERVLDKNRQNIFVSMGFMILIALLSMGFLYRNQNRHLARMREVERRLHQAERLSALGRLASGVAHEIRNPLNAISMAVQRLQRDNPHKLTTVIRDEINSLNQIVEEVLSLSRSRRLELKTQNVTALLDQILLLLEEEAESKGIRIEKQWDKPVLMVPMDLEKMKQAFLNIIRNALESIPNEGAIMLSAGPGPKGWAAISISDTGTGMKPEEMKRIFDLEYTTKDKGLGLGLPLAYEIVRGHGGEIRVSSRPGRGSTFEILLPRDRYHVVESAA